MPRGGKRAGTPGKGYSNRTDMGQNYMSTADSNTAATGGVSGETAAPAAPPPMLPSRSPDDSPMLTDPSNNPGEPLTAGLDYGPGPDSSALGLPKYSDERQADIETLKQMLPELKAASKFDGSPATFKSLVAYLSRL